MEKQHDVVSMARFLPDYQKEILADAVDGKAVTHQREGARELEVKGYLAQKSATKNSPLVPTTRAVAVVEYLRKGGTGANLEPRTDGQTPPDPAQSGDAGDQSGDVGG